MFRPASAWQYRRNISRTEASSMADELLVSTVKVLLIAAE
jgi:hypothetical protein